MLILSRIVIILYLKAKYLYIAARYGDDEMWYKEAIGGLDSKREYTRQQLYSVLIVSA